MNRDTSTLVHASCVTFDGHGVLITGPSGAGKSDLAMRLIDAPGFGTGDIEMKARLVGDDQILLTCEDGKVLARPVPELEGLLEIRGIGIIRLTSMAETELRLAVRLADRSTIERLPADDNMRTTLCGVEIPCITVDASCASAPARVRSGLHALTQSGDRTG